MSKVLIKWYFFPKGQKEQSKFPFRFPEIIEVLKESKRLILSL